MKEKQRKYIHENYREKTVRQMAAFLQVSKKEVSAEVRKILGNKKKSPLLNIFVIIFVPIIILAMLEGGLRLIGMYDGTELLIKTEKSGKEWYQLNKNVAKRWFISGNTSVPELNNTLLYEVDKPDTVKRILCLGGSTTAGFPFDNLPPFPSLVRLKLQRYFPRYTIETVNLGISAINSFSVADLVEETLPLKPDMVLVYMGHNEFYGAFGGSSSQSFGSRGLVKTILWLDHFAIVQNLRKLLTPGVDKKDISRQNKTLMAQMIKDKYIALNKEAYRATRENFKINYNEIVDFYKKNNIPILISTLTSNLKDQVPFESRWQPQDADKKQKFWLQAEATLKLGDLTKAKAMMEKLYAIDNSHAELNYYLGRFAMAGGDTLMARNYFFRARENDGMRFRAPAEWNHIIKKISIQQNVPLVRMDSVFSAFSPGQMVGHELLLEHLHPNWRGYNLMADAFIQGILNQKLINENHPSFRWSTLEKYPWYNVTDMEIGHLVYSILTKGWPFNQEVFEYENYRPLAPKAIAENVKDYVSMHGYWNKLHYKSAEVFIETKDYSNAIREYAAVAAYLPSAKFPREKMGFLYLVTQDFKNAYGVYHQLLELEPENAEYQCRVGQSLAMGYQFKTAIPYLEDGIVKDVNSGRKMEATDFYNYKFWLGFCYANTGQLLFAKRQLEQVLENIPQHTEARKLLNQVIAFHRQQSKKSKK